MADLTVVITCRDDRRLARAVRSIDGEAEVLVVLNGSPPEFARWVDRELGDRVHLESLPFPSRAASVEHGIRAARHERVLLMDADCVFDPGSVDAVARAFRRGTPEDEVYKGHLVYEAGRSPVSGVIARSRTQRNRRLSAYKPALAFSRAIVDRIGGYFFDRRMIWKSDAELDGRIRAAGLRLVRVDGCTVRHAPLSLRTDLYSSFHYGVGTAIARHLELSIPAPERSLREAWRRDGAAAALYMLLANQVLACGRAYAAARLRTSGERWLARVTGA